MQEVFYQFIIQYQTTAFVPFIYLLMEVCSLLAYCCVKVWK